MELLYLGCTRGITRRQPTLPRNARFIRQDLTLRRVLTDNPAFRPALQFRAGGSIKIHSLHVSLTPGSAGWAL
jgi:hypothetical protein